MTPAYVLPSANVGRHTVEMILTPEIARRMLVRNTHPRQRSLMPSSVNGWHQRYMRGEHTETHQGIAFGVDGHLYDGQHRLTALARCPDKTQVSMLVTFNLQPASFMAMDQGKGRTTAHALGEHPDLVAVARAIASIDHGGRTALTPHLLQPYVNMIRKPFEELMSDGASIKYRYWSSAMVRAAAVIWMLDGRSSRQYIVNAYRALNRQTFMDMTPHVLSLAQREHRGDMPRPATVEAFALISRAFDEKAANNTKAQVKDATLYGDWVRAICRDHLNKQPVALALAA